MHAEENIVKKNKENYEVLKAFFASIFNSKTCSGPTQSSELEDRDREQTEGPMLCLKVTKYAKEGEVGELPFVSKMGLIAQSCL